MRIDFDKVTFELAGSDWTIILCVRFFLTTQDLHRKGGKSCANVSELNVLQHSRIEKVFFFLDILMHISEEAETR